MADYRIKQPWADANLKDVNGVPLGWNGTEIAGWAYLESLSALGFTRLTTSHTSTGLVVPDLGGATAANVPLLIKAADLASLSSSLKADWGDLRLSTDIEGYLQLPLDIVQEGSIAWTRVPTVAVDTVIYVWGNKADAVKEIDGSAFGRNAVWSTSERRYHFEDDPTGGTITDASGNTDGTLAGTYSAGDKVAGVNGSALRFTLNDGFLNAGTVSPVANQPKSVSLLTQFQTLTSIRGLWSVGDTWTDGTPSLLMAMRSSSVDMYDIVGYKDVFTPVVDTPYKIDYVYDGSTTTIYVDGALATSYASDDGNAENGQTLYVNSGYLEQADQIISEFEYTEYAKTPDQISIEYQNQSANDAWWVSEDAGAGGILAPVTGGGTVVSTVSKYVDIADSVTSTSSILTVASKQIGTTSTVVGGGAPASSSAKQIGSASALSAGGLITSLGTKLGSTASLVSAISNIYTSVAKLVNTSTLVTGGGTVSTVPSKLIDVSTLVTGGGTLQSIASVASGLVAGVTAGGSTSATSSKLANASTNLASGGSVSAQIEKSAQALSFIASNGTTNAQTSKLVSVASPVSAAASTNAQVSKLASAISYVSGGGSILSTIGDTITSIVSGGGSLLASVSKTVQESTIVQAAGQLLSNVLRQSNSTATVSTPATAAATVSKLTTTPATLTGQGSASAIVSSIRDLQQLVSAGGVLNTTTGKLIDASSSLSTGGSTLVSILPYKQSPAAVLSAGGNIIARLSGKPPSNTNITFITVKAAVDTVKFLEVYV